MAQQGVKFARVHGRIVPIRQKAGGGSGGKAPVKAAAPKRKPAKEPLRMASRMFTAGMGALAIGVGIHFASPFLKGALRTVGGGALAAANGVMMKASKNGAVAARSRYAVATNLNTAKRGLRGIAHPLNMLGGFAGGMFAGMGAGMIGRAFRKRSSPRTSV